MPLWSEAGSAVPTRPGARAPARASGRAGGAGDARELPPLSPLLAEAASGTIEPRHAVVPLRPMLKKVHVITGAIDSIDVDAHTAVATDPRCAPRAALPGPRARAGSVPSTLPIPGSPRRPSASRPCPARSGCGTASSRSSRPPRPSRRRSTAQLLTFTFVGGAMRGRGARRARVAHPRRTPCTHAARSTCVGCSSRRATRSSRASAPASRPTRFATCGAVASRSCSRRAHVVRRQARRDRGRQHEGLPHGHARVDRGQRPSPFVARSDCR